MPDKQPNILIFMTDQQRGSTIIPGHPMKALTPNVDRFREEGLTFLNASCPSPHCCPSRATFFSGLYPTEHGVWNNVQVQNTLSQGLSCGVRLWSEDLRDAGYKLHWAGKWHVSNVENPDERGFTVHSLTGEARKSEKDYSPWGWDEYKSLAAKTTHNKARLPGEILREGYCEYVHYGLNEAPFGDEVQIERGIAALKDAAEGQAPWCLYLGPLGPHDPYKVPERFLNLYDPEQIELSPSFGDKMEDKPSLYRRTRDQFDQLTEAEHREAVRHYLAFCSYEDYLFGKVLTALEESGRAQDTLVVYVSDHGDYLSDHGLWCKGLPAFRGAYDIPCVIRWPEAGYDPGSSVTEFVSLADFAPTFLEAAGFPVTADEDPVKGSRVEGDRKFTGASLLPFLRGEKPPVWRKEMFTQSNGNELYGIQRSITTEKWKYIYNGFDYDELYNLENDPHECKNRIDSPEHKEIVRELIGKLWRFGYEHGENCINPYIMVALAPYGPAAAFSPTPT